jgi:ribosomal protein S27AE
VLLTWEVDDSSPVAGRHYPKDLAEFNRWFKSESSAAKYLTDVRFRNGFACPRCGVVVTRSGGSRWWCGDCRRWFTLTTGTLLAKWIGSESHAGFEQSGFGRHVPRLRSVSGPTESLDEHSHDLFVRGVSEQGQTEHVVDNDASGQQTVTLLCSLMGSDREAFGWSNFAQERTALGVRSNFQAYHGHI